VRDPYTCMEGSEKQPQPPKPTTTTTTTSQPLLQQDQELVQKLDAYNREVKNQPPIVLQPILNNIQNNFLSRNSEENYIFVDVKLKKFMHGQIYSDVQFKAIVDTGCPDALVIPETLAVNMGLKVKEGAKGKLGGIQGIHMTTSDVLQIALQPGKNVISNQQIITNCAVTILQRDTFLLGLVALKSMDIVIDCKDKKLSKKMEVQAQTIAFPIPYDVVPIGTKLMHDSKKRRLEDE